MISLADARAHVAERVAPLPVEAVPVGRAVGLVTAAPVHAGEPVPPFDNTAMDGFAVRAADVAGASDAAPVGLPVVGTIAAGAGDLPTVGEGEAARIMTGAPLPPGADAVVMVERTEVVGERVLVQVAVEPGNHVRRAGEDLEQGAVAVPAGTVLTPAHVGLCHTVGAVEVAARRRPRVGVLSTGDELVLAPGALAPGQIRDSNRPTLLALVEAHGFVPVDLGRIPDDEAALEAALTEGAATCDVLLSTGGVSMGDFDLVKVVLDRVGEMAWMQVAIRPAKPLAFGLVGGTPVFGLPGNPVSSVVSYELFARPALRWMTGHPRPDRATVEAVAAEPLTRRPDGKVHFARVRAERSDDDVVLARSAGGQGSHQLSALAAANALAVLPDGEGVPEGGAVTLLPLGVGRRRPRADPYPSPMAATPDQTDLIDGFGRVHRDLRISVTDRCNFRCTYCMPEEGMTWLDRSEVLTYEEVTRVARVFVDRFGFDSIRLTGGEPTVRAHLPVLVDKLAALGVDLALTTNGATLRGIADDLAAAGLDRVNVSCDSLRRDRFRDLTRRDELPAVLEGIRAAAAAGLGPVKVNAVVMRGVNDDEIVDFARFGRDEGVTVRFIEFMPLDADEQWDESRVVPRDEIVAAVDAVFPVEPVGRGHQPAERYRFVDGRGEIGVIPSVTDAFCDSCDRVRLTAEGGLRNCLFALEETDLRALLRSGATDDDLAEAITASVAAKWAGHQIGRVHFIRPAKSMSQIGG